MTWTWEKLIRKRLWYESDDEPKGWKLRKLNWMLLSNQVDEVVSNSFSILHNQLLLSWYPYNSRMQMPFSTIVFLSCGSCSYIKRIFSTNEICRWRFFLLEMNWIYAFVWHRCCPCHHFHTFPNKKKKSKNIPHTLGGGDFPKLLHCNNDLWLLLVSYASTSMKT